MQRLKQVSVSVQNIVINSIHLHREVIVDIYLPAKQSRFVSLLIINDGQDLPKFHFDQLLADLYDRNEIEPIICVKLRVVH